MSDRLSALLKCRASSARSRACLDHARALPTLTAPWLYLPAACMAMNNGMSSEFICLTALPRAARSTAVQIGARPPPFDEVFVWHACSAILLGGLPPPARRQSLCHTRPSVTCKLRGSSLMCGLWRLIDSKAENRAVHWRAGWTASLCQRAAPCSRFAYAGHAMLPKPPQTSRLRCIMWAHPRSCAHPTNETCTAARPSACPVRYQGFGTKQTREQCATTICDFN